MEAKDFSFKAVLDPKDRQEIIDAVVAGILLQIQGGKPDGAKVEQEAPISRKEVCQLLSCSEQTIIKWQAAGKIPFRRKGRRVYFFKSEVLKSLEQPLTR